MRNRWRILKLPFALLLGIAISFSSGHDLMRMTRSDSATAQIIVPPSLPTDQRTASPTHQLAVRPTEQETDALTLDEQARRGRQLYLDGQFAAAIALWQHIAQIYAAQNNPLAQSSTLSNLALAYQQLGQWEDAQTAIANSLQHLATAPTTKAKWPVQAQALMAKGSLQIARGQPEEALESWQQAERVYTNSDDIAGSNRAQINQAQALRELGFYYRAVEKLHQVKDTMESQPRSPLTAVMLRRLGEALKLTGELTEAQAILTQSLAIAEQHDLTEEVSATLLSLGHVARSAGTLSAADDFYKRAIAALASNPSAGQLVPIQLAQLSLWAEPGQENSQWPELTRLWPAIQQQFDRLPPSRTAVYYQVNWANSLIAFNQAVTASVQTDDVSVDAVDWLVIAQQLQRAVEQAHTLADPRAEAYAVGTLGQVYEQTQQWAIAQSQTQKALRLANGAADMAYRWQWQLGRIRRSPSNPEQSVPKAIDAYSQAITSLAELRGDLAAGSDTMQFSFQKEVEPIYRQLVDILLQTDRQAPEYQQNLGKAQDVIESLRLAELDNYFKEACTDTQPVDIRQIDQKAAVIHSIVLEDRLSVILRLPNQPLQHFSTDISASEVTEMTTQLRQQLVIRSRRDYFPLAEQVYQWLIAPARTAIDRSGIDTLVFVLDGPLQNIPMATLYDGDRFLIEDYSVALTPGLNLMDPQSWSPTGLSVLAAGLTESRLGLAPLPYVATEIEKITEHVSRTATLINQQFTHQTLPDKLKSTPYPVVHIATHGQFGATPEETYLLAWDELIKVKEISQMLQANLGDREAIELLVLSACETASGNQQAALGLSGIAIKAGARSTIGTLWAINDEATSIFVGYLYQQLMRPNTTRADALRQAQIKLLEDPQYRHPIYWAPYVLLGSWL
ncbi:MAG: CHAT domain-containing protein [Phormidesmis sp.]